MHSIVDQISLKDKLAAEYLRFMTFMSEKAIPSDILHAAYDDEASDVGGDQKDETDRPPSEVDDTQVEKSIGKLAAYAFMTNTSTVHSYDMHRLVPLSMRNWLQKRNVATMYDTQVVMRLGKLFQILRYENKGFWLMYLPHNRHIFSPAVDPKGHAAKRWLVVNITIVRLQPMTQRNDLKTVILLLLASTSLYIYYYLGRLCLREIPSRNHGRGSFI